MGSFDVKYEINFSDDKKVKKSSFSMTLSLREHSLALGQYVIYPCVERNELIFLPKFKFRAYEARFRELYEKNNAAEREKAKDVKPKNRKHTMTEAEIKELHKLRGIISNSKSFNITGYDTEVKLPYSFLKTLNMDIDFLTFIPTGRCEFIIVNPTDAWMYSPNVYSEYSYGNDNYDDDNSPKNFINRIKRAI